MKLAQLVGAVASAVMCLEPSAAVFAEPGQSLAQFSSWAARRDFLRGMGRAMDELSGQAAFDVLAADHGIVWHFHARTNGRTIRAESLEIGQSPAQPGSMPIRHDGTGYGIVFFRALYGKSIAADYLAAARVASITDRDSHVRSVFYRGKRFGYEVAGGALTITTRAGAAADRALLQRCTLTPNACSE